MKIKFKKMHGLGNDFILIDNLGDENNYLLIPEHIRKLCNRRFGIGADQILLLLPSDKYDYKMRIFNSDGLEVEMCGNGIRCLAKYLHTHVHTSKKEFNIETLAGVIKPAISDGQVVVDMGVPILNPGEIPVNLEEDVIGKPIHINDLSFNVTCVSMGNPHCVIFCDNVKKVPLDSYGPLLENHSLFPKKINVEFVEILGRNKIKMRVWERGSGITMACGTGACASVVASILNDKTDKNVKVCLDGGELYIRWDKNNHIYMTGPAETVFDGEVEIH